MTIRATYTQAHENLASLMDEATQNRQVVIIRRRGKEAVALVPAVELESLLETAHLLRSSPNAKRLLEALEGALRRESTPITLEQLRAEVGIE